MSTTIVYEPTQEHLELCRLWKELTDTERPFDWSQKYLMPVMTMVPEQEAVIARKAFSTINRFQNDTTAIARAMDYISKMSYADSLNSKEERDKAFAASFLKEYSVLFNSVDTVKDYLKKHVSELPYYWLESKEVASKLKSLVKERYVESGCVRAKKIIDEMPADELKEYLKQLTEGNIVVGVEIIRGKE